MKRPSPRQLGQELRLAGGRMRDEFARWTTYERLYRQFEDLMRTLERLENKYQAYRHGIDKERAERGLPPYKPLKEKVRVPDTIDPSYLQSEGFSESAQGLAQEESPSSSPPSSPSSPPEPSGG